MRVMLRRNGNRQKIDFAKIQITWKNKLRSIMPLEILSFICLICLVVYLFGMPTTWKYQRPTKPEYFDTTLKRSKAAETLDGTLMIFALNEGEPKPDLLKVFGDRKKELSCNSMN